MTINAIAALSLAGFLSSPALAVVPFLRTPAPAPAAQPAAAPAIRACATTDLQAAVGATGAHKGFATQELRLTNRAGQACYLTGAPAIALHPHNAAAQEVARHPNGAANLQARTDLAPGDTAVVLIGAPGACDAAIGPERKVSTRLQVSLPGGGAHALEGAHVDTLCGAATVLHLHVEPAPAAPARLAQLESAIRLEGRPMPGSELHYTVTLTNPTSAAISLAPCPSFTQSLFGDVGLGSSTLRLNCEAAGNQIAAGASVAFEMLLSVPAHVAADTAKLSWKLEDGPGAGTAVPLRGQ